MTKWGPRWRILREDGGGAFLTQNRIARVLFCIHQGLMALLQGFIKKTQLTPEDDLEAAAHRVDTQAAERNARVRERISQAHEYVTQQRQ